MKISCIIPAYNEEKRLGAVLEVVTIHPLIDEVVVINDGSKDKTQSIINSFSNIKIINNLKNSGKSASIYLGIKESTGDYLLFIDADLIGLKIENITALINPVKNNLSDVSISLRINSPWPWRFIGLDYISGERVLSKKLVEDKLEQIKNLPGFGLEVFLNSLIIENKQKIAVVRWDNVRSPFKYQKFGILKGVMGDIKMIVEIFKVISPLGALKQISNMLNLKQAL